MDGHCKKFMPEYDLKKRATFIKFLAVEKHDLLMSSSFGQATMLWEKKKTKLY